MAWKVVKPVLADRLQEKKDIQKMIKSANGDVKKYEKMLKDTEKKIAALKKK